MDEININHVVHATPLQNIVHQHIRFHFGNIAVFDDPITLDNNFHSTPVGRAQGMYIYDTKNTFTAWLGFTFVLNSAQHKGTISFIGADPIMVKSRDISVVGGTGDFFMHRGIATIMTDSYEEHIIIIQSYKILAETVEFEMSRPAAKVAS
ncbi:hypothetical protein LXL04_026384 [Taraxacum kok-saghyz]